MNLPKNSHVMFSCMLETDVSMHNIFHMSNLCKGVTITQAEIRIAEGCKSQSVVRLFSLLRDI